ncbi:hypothetical protein GUITHDRAFT_103175 [Guillardia theta CCMP2712]|uniref:Uncharacterized protein n=1 Tax=Guillardia theta (strain CCMP2712) TaxID=905079 RepID=L1JS37_GUITC|nr:hypothetical protein GUITHDRAFT_103175 [Guillardia theta CCMP2712]EKX51257.1 hypothetical protein GUITHDRAFT_103175 [Guillardia theta CCMP2712]|eukprot:XP_005838237.1 hypothetical protein GUITHDRAFT_103175 [Guillardia theta CCMP2712]
MAVGLVAESDGDGGIRLKIAKGDEIESVMVIVKQLQSEQKSMVKKFEESQMQIASLKRENDALKKELGDLTSIKLHIGELVNSLNQIKQRQDSFEEFIEAKNKETEKVKAMMDNVKQQNGKDLQNIKELEDKVDKVEREYLAFNSYTVRSINTLQEELHQQQVLVHERVGYKELNVLKEEWESESKRVAASVKEFEAVIEDRLRGKADLTEIKMKLDRYELDDLLSNFTQSIEEKLRSRGKIVQEIRDDVDAILALMVQDANVAAVTTQCLSCEKTSVSMRPGPPPGSGREPVLMEGSDGRYYHGPESSPRRASETPNRAAMDVRSPRNMSYSESKMRKKNVSMQSDRPATAIPKSKQEGLLDSSPLSRW